jgi:hypothetical protein
MRAYNRPEGLIRKSEEGKVTAYHEFSPDKVSQKSRLLNDIPDIKNVCFWSVGK